MAKKPSKITFLVVYLTLSSLTSSDRHEAIENCRRAMKLAHREFEVPMVLEPEYLASPWLDELSGMTYLSYFMKPDSPGFRATLDWVNSKLERGVTNFTVRVL